MSKVLIIGCGGVGTVVAHKCAQHPEVFTEIVIASRTKSKCDAVAKAIGKSNISTDSVDADNVEELVALLNRHKPELVINVALPYQDLTIMEACLQCGVNYLDTANYEPKDVAHFEYSWQWAYRTLRAGRTHGNPRLRLRPRSKRRVHGICGQALLRRDGNTRHRGLQRR